ncbi:MAG: ABC transporter ATP-binding protein [Slackia sp.]|uniref:ABC transporter ATP-binding protein n=1 Tax=Slackia sp. TaxID=2049041 RepID=UPI00283ECB59|nr:ABC transporter ATP-binding protein [Slackia sp.]MDR3900123.1 ABC transporter ATP-binding protein [Slackia sp.]
MGMREKYALTAEGAKNIRLGAFWTVIVNLVAMFGIGFFFYLMEQLIASLTEGAALPDMVPYGVGLVIFAVVLWVAHWFQYDYTYGKTYRESGKQRISLGERMRELPLSFFGKRDLADLTETIMTDATTMEHVYSHVLPYLYGTYISTAIIAVCLLVFNWQLAIAALWSVPVAFAILFWSRRFSAPLMRKTRACAIAMTENIQEMLECVREIRATNQVASYLKQADDYIDRHERATFKSEVGAGIPVQLAQAIMRFGIATAILVGSLMLADGSIGFMVMFGFLLVVSRIYAPFDQSMLMLAELFMATEVAAPRMKALYDEVAATGSEDFSPQGHDVTFEDVTFSYGEGDEPVVSNVSFVAKEGDVTALVGPSGSGKSTLTKLAARFWDADGGRVLVGGVDASTIDPETLLKDYSVVFQDVLLFDDTVMGNIRLGRRDATDEEVLAAAKAAMCDDFVRKLPQGYDTMIGENGSKLSGGERQRISIARALLKDSPIVLLDEATASLDVENESQVQEALSNLLAGKTVIVIAHRMRTVMNANKIVVLDEGHVVEQGAPAELLEQNGLFSRMVRLQSESSGWSLAGATASGED